MADTRGIKAGRAYVELGTSDQLSKGLAKAQAQLRAFATGIQSIGKGLMAGGAAIVAPILASAKTFVSVGSHLKDISDRTGVSVEALSELGYAATQTGASLDGVEKGIRKMQRSIVDAADGTQTAVEALGRLGLTATELQGLKPEAQFEAIAKRLREIHDPTLRAAVAMELFGRSGSTLLPMIADLEALREAAHKVGATMTADDAANAHALGDAMDDLRFSLRSVALTVGAAVAPMLKGLAQTITAGVGVIRNFVNKNRELIRTALQVGAAIAGIGAVLFGMGTSIKVGLVAVGGLGSALAFVAASLKAVGLILVGMASPIAIAVAGLAAVGAAAIYYSDVGHRALSWLGDTFHWLGETFRSVMRGISDALTAGDVQLATDILWSGMRLAWLRGTSSLRNIWNDLVFGMVVAWQTALMEITADLAYAVMTWEKIKASGKGWGQKFINALGGGLAMIPITLQADSWEEVFQAQRDIIAKINTEGEQIDKQTAAEINKATDAWIDKERAAAAKMKEGIEGASKDNAQALADAAAELAAAEKALRKARSKAAEEAKRTPAPSGRPAFPNMELPARQVVAALELAAIKFSASGTFSPYAVQGLGGGLRKMEVKLDDIKRELRELNRKGPLVFSR